MDNMYALPKGYLLKGKYWIWETVGWDAAGINYEAVDIRSLSWHGNSHMADAFDYFEENHTVYLVTKYLDGIPLDRNIRQYGTLSEGEILHIFIRWRSRCKDFITMAYSTGRYGPVICY